MKKGMMEIAMCVVLSFLVSVIAVSISFAARATQTAPKSQQQPSTVQIKDQIKAKDKFWDLEFDRLEVKGFVIKKGGGNKTINVKVGENVQFRAYYKVKTIPIGDITEADANYWGSGKFLYTNHLLIVNHKVQGNNYIRLFDTNISTPKFTRYDVIHWKKILATTARKTWNEESVFQWNPAADCVGHNVYINCVCVDWYKKIPETDEPNNGFVDSDLLVTFIVIP
jgi:hypothetical protein